jgi:hypothetical protein
MAFSPDVWSGRASQGVFDDLADVGLASYPAFDWSVLCSRPRWISARVRPHEPTGLDWAIRRKPVFECALEDRSSISFQPLADLGG